MQNTIFAVIASGSLGLLIGLWQGKSSEAEGWHRLMRSSDVSEGCRRQLFKAADGINASAESQRRP